MPEIYEQVKRLLENNAEQYVIRQMSEKYKKLLMTPSYYRLDDMPIGNIQDSQVDVLIFVVEHPCEGRKKPVQLVWLDGNGEVLEEKVELGIGFKNLDTMSKNEEDLYNISFEQIRDNLKKRKPKLIIVGANCQEAETIFNTISKKDLLIECYGAIECEKVKISFAPLKLQHYFLKFPSPLQQSAISLGRYAQNPLSEILNTWVQMKEGAKYRIEDFMELHPLQNLVSRELSDKCLENIAVECVNAVGIDVNKIIGHKHLFAQLRFVSGLGKFRANAILEELEKNGILKTRIELLDRRILKDLVYRNCSSFIKVITSKEIVNNFRELLDTTRIHPECYKLSKQLILRALTEIGYANLPPQDDNNSILATLSPINGKKPLDNLLTNIEERNVIFLKELIKEIEFPFKDPRIDRGDSQLEELPFLLQGITASTMYEGQILSATVIKASENGITVRLENGLDGIIMKMDKEDEGAKNSRLSEGNKITARIEKIKCQDTKIQIHLTITKKDLTSHERYLKIRQQDRVWFYVDPLDLETNVKLNLPTNNVTDTPKEVTQTNTQKYKPRTIEHPKFQNCTLQQALNYLRGKNIGEFIFRPSSVGEDHITLTLALHKKILVNIDIKEVCKLPGSSIGGKLWIGDDSFESLEEIVSQYINPVIENIQKLTKERKFISNTSMSFIEEFMAMEHSKNPNIINYGFAMVPEYPQYVMILYYTKDKILKEYAKIKPRGFYFHEKYFKTISDLTIWFKQNFSSTEYQIFRRKSKPPTLQPHPHEIDIEERELRGKRNNPENEGEILDITPSQMPCNTTYLPGTEYALNQDIIQNTYGNETIYGENVQFSVYKEKEPSFSLEPERKRGCPSQRTTQTCFKCGQEGHLSYDCPSRDQRGRRGEFRRRDSRFSRGGFNEPYPRRRNDFGGGGMRRGRDNQFGESSGGRRSWRNNGGSPRTDDIWGKPSEEKQEKTENSWVAITGENEKKKENTSEVAAKEKKILNDNIMREAAKEIPKIADNEAAKVSLERKPKEVDNPWEGISEEKDKDTQGIWGAMQNEEKKKEAQVIPNKTNDIPNENVLANLPTVEKIPNNTDSGLCGEERQKNDNLTLTNSKPLEDDKKDENNLPHSPQSDDYKQFNTIEEPRPISPNKDNSIAPWEEDKKGTEPVAQPVQNTDWNPITESNTEKSTAWDNIPKRGDRGMSRAGRGVCFNCNEEGHMSRDCPNKRRERGRSNLCYKCHQPGHIAVNCTESDQNTGYRSRSEIGREVDVQIVGGDLLGIDHPMQEMLKKCKNNRNGIKLK